MNKHYIHFSQISFILLCFALISSQIVYGQTPCGFDSLHHHSGPEVYFIDEEISEMISPSGGMYQALSSNHTYEIPVVVHVIYLNNEFDPTYISSAQVINGIDLLNDDFRRTGAGMGTGADVNIEFCLAQRDPDGKPTTGIIYYDGTNICNPDGNLCYFTEGFSAQNETAIKENKVWPQEDYLNIWVVHKISSGAFGLARYPGIRDPFFGPIIKYDFFGNGVENRILTHEVGHSLALRHTFEGDEEGSICPPASNTLDDGDFCTDTDPHKRTNNNCDLGETNDCLPSELLDLLKRNYMDYSSRSCMNRFTNDQRMRMRATLMGPLNGLMHSLGCSPSCPDVTASFTPNNDTPVESGTSFLFTSTSTSVSDLPLSHTWYVNGIEQGNQSTFQVSLNEPGLQRICLQSNNGLCSNQYCIEFVVYSGVECLPEPSSCENVILNGSFDNNTPEQPAGLNFFELCEWRNAISFPRVCYFDDLVADDYLLTLFGPNSSGRTTQAAISLSPITGLTVGNDYSLNFDYQCLGTDDCELLIALVPNIDYEMFVDDPADILPPGSQIIYSNSQIPLMGAVSGNAGPQCARINPNIDLVAHPSIEFTYENVSNNYLFISSMGRDIPSSFNTRILSLNNVSLNTCCELNPQIDIEAIDDCTYRFLGDNLGDEASFIWSIEGGPQSVPGQNIDYTFAVPGEYEVCLTVICDDFSTDDQICTMIDIGIDCFNCSDAVVLNGNALSCPTDNNYQANISIYVDPGFAPCRFNGVDLFGDGISYSDHSYNASTSTMDLVLNFDSPPTGIYQMVLCGPNNESRCFLFSIENTTECTSCEDLNLTVQAECIDEDPTDNIQVYGGSIDLNLPAGSAPCGGVSNIAGLSLGQISNVGGATNVPFTISTSNNQIIQGNITLCFVLPDLRILCFNFDVEVTDPCPIVPTNCFYGSEWTLVCEQTEDGISTFSFNHLLGANSLFNSGYELCETEGITTTYGNFTVVNSGITQSGQGFYTDIDFEISCDDVANSETMVMTFHFCNPDGSEICIDFFLNFSCSECSINRSSKSAKTEKEILVYPNPANNFMQIHWDNPEEQTSRIRIYTTSGQDMIKTIHNGNSATVDIASFDPGVYVVIVEVNNKRLIDRFIKL